MDHPHIAAVLDAGKTDSSRLYFAMEMVRGMPLTEHSDAHRLTLRQRLELFIPVCQAVQHAHQKGVLHRDLKPSNILVTMVDGKPSPKVIDFGIAKALQTGAEAAEGLSLLQTQGLSLIGTPLYMSPEQAGLSGLDVDSRSDIYSLGVVLYELLIGTTPLSKETLHKAAIDEVLRLIREQDPPSLEHCLMTLGKQTQTVAAQRQTEMRKLASQVRGDIQWIVLRALEKDRERRYASASALAEDIQHHLRDEPVSAGPPGAAYRLGKMARKHKGPLAAAALVMLSMLAGIGFTVWQAVRATKAEHLAESRLGDAEKARDSAEALVTEGIHGMRGKLLALGKVEALSDMVKAAESYFKALPPELLGQEKSQRHLASLALNRATIALALGRSEEQKKHAEECLNIMDSLLAKNPERDDLADEASFAMLSLWYLHMDASDFDALLPMSDRLTHRCQTWLKTHPDTLWAMYYQVLAQNMVALSLVRDKGEALQAQMRFMAAVEITKRMRAVHGEKSQVCEAEGLMHAGQAKVAERLKQQDMSIQEFEASAASFTKAMELGGDSALLREARWSAVYRAGSGLRSRGKQTQNAAEDKRGEDLLLQALEGRRKLVELEPGRGEWWRDLANSHSSMASLHYDRKNLEAELASRLEELRCREEALVRSPQRPLLLSNRAKTRDDLVGVLLRQSEPPVDKAVEHLLTSLRDLRASIEMNAMTLVLSNDKSEFAVKKLLRLAVTLPAKGQSWLEQAAAILEPLAGKVEKFDAPTSLALIAKAQTQVLAALGKEKEAAAAAQKLQAMTAATVSAQGRMEIAEKLRTTAGENHNKAVALSDPTQRQAAHLKVEAEIREVLKLAAVVLAEDPKSLPARKLNGQCLHALAYNLQHQGKVRQRDSVQAFLAAISHFDPEQHATELSESHYACAGSHLDLYEYDAASKHARSSADILEALSGSTTPASEDLFRRTGLAWARHAKAEDLAGRPATALTANDKAIKAHKRAFELLPSNHNRLWDIASAQVENTSILLATKKLPEAQELTQAALRELPTLIEKESKTTQILDFADNKLAKLAGNFITASLYGTAADIQRAVILLRRRAEKLTGHLPDDFEKSAYRSRFSVVKLLHLQKKPQEAEAELQTALTEAEKGGSKLYQAEAQKFASSVLREVGVRDRVEAYARTAHQLAQENDLGWRGTFCTLELVRALEYLGKQEEALPLVQIAWDKVEAKTWPGQHERLRVEVTRRACELHHSLHIRQPNAARLPAAQQWLQRLHDEALRSQPKNEGAWSSVVADASGWMTQLVLDGDAATFRTLRTALLKNTAPFGSAGLQHRTASICLALPADGAELADIVQRAAAAYKNAPQAEKHRYAYTQSLSLIRSGKSAEALKIITPWLGRGNTTDWLMRHALSSLAHRALGDTAAADAELKTISTASDLHQRTLTSPTAGDSILARTLIREASQVQK
ncbi:MAG: serine/threonine protein kinase [Verrucomicrobiaceae bacterium]|nr:serine/threonine protein kinase [Verrucomicrobiaceae bacterium]